MVEKNAQKKFRSVVTVCEKIKRRQKSTFNSNCTYSYWRRVFTVLLLLLLLFFATSLARPNKHKTVAYDFRTHTNSTAYNANAAFTAHAHKKFTFFYGFFACAACCCCYFFFRSVGRPPNSHMNCSLKSKNVENSLLTSNYGDNSI